MSTYSSTPDVLGFYAALGIDLPDRAGNVPTRCFLPEHDDRNASASVSTDMGTWFCHRCTQGGGPFDAALALGHDKRDAVEQVKRFGLWRGDDEPALSSGNGRLPAPARPPAPLPSEEEMRGWRERLLGSDPVLERLRELRGWSRETVERFTLGFDGERVVIPVRGRDDRMLTVLRYRPSASEAGGKKILAPAGRGRELFPPPEALDGDAVWLVEGEPDAIAAHELHLPAVAVPGTGYAGSVEKWAPRFAGRRVVISLDDDDAGRKAAERIAPVLAGHAADVRVLSLEALNEERREGYDLTDVLLDARANGGVENARTVLLKAAEGTKPLERTVAGAQPAVPCDETSDAGVDGGGVDHAGAGSGSKLRHLDLARMVSSDPPRVPWVIEGLVVRGMLTVLNGKEGEGKSLLAMALAAGVAAGQDEAGLACEPGRVLIVDAENGEHEIHRRVRTLELPSADVDAFEAQGFDLRSDLGDLERILSEHSPDLLVLDSYRSLWGGEENDSREVAAVLDPLRNLVRRVGAGCLLLHHSGKSNSAYRGSSAIGASTELGFRLARLEDDSDPHRRYLETWKCRPAQKPPKRWLRLSVESGRVFIDAAEAPEREAPEVEAPVREELTPRVLAVLTDEPQSRADIARAVEREPKDRSVGRVLEGLTASGEAVKSGPEPRPKWRHAQKVAGGEGVGGKGGCHLPPSLANQHSKAESEGGNPPATFEGLPPSSEADEAEAERVERKLESWEAAA